MRKLIPLLALALAATAPCAQAATYDHTVGAQLDAGAAAIIGDDLSDLDPKLRFAMGLGGHYEYRLNETLGLVTGLGFMGKGCRFSSKEYDYSERYKLLYLTIPLGAQARFGNIRAYGSIPLNFALRGKIKYKSGDN